MNTTGGPWGAPEGSPELAGVGLEQLAVPAFVVVMLLFFIAVLIALVARGVRNQVVTAIAGIGAVICLVGVLALGLVLFTS